MIYTVNKDAIIFLDEDRLGGFNTVAYDYRSDDLIAIRPLEYKLLWSIFDRGQASAEDIGPIMGEELTENETKEMVETLIEKGVLLAHE